MSDDGDRPTVPFIQGRKLLEQLGVTLPREIAPIAAPDPALDSSVPPSFGSLTAISEVDVTRGRVVLAQDEELGRSVAVRLLDRAGAGRTDAVEAFVGEARILARLGHPGAPTVHQLGHTEDGELYLVTSQTDGRSLREALGDRTESWTAGRCARVALSVAEVLACAHDRRVVVGSLDPARIRMGHFGEVVLSDWSGATLHGPDPVEEAAKSLQKRASRTALISPLATSGLAAPPPARYGSPEQACDGHVDERSDVFSFGALLFELLTLEAAFDDDTVGREDIGPPDPRTRRADRTVPEGLARIIDGALRFDPAERPSIQRVRMELIAWLDGPRTPPPADEVEDANRELRWRIRDLKQAAATLQSRIEALDGAVDGALPDPGPADEDDGDGAI